MLLIQFLNVVNKGEKLLIYDRTTHEEFGLYKKDANELSRFTSRHVADIFSDLTGNGDTYTQISID